jgi:thioredoxin 1/putative thioredoxin
LIEPYLPRAAGAVTALEAAELIKSGRITPVDIREAAVYNRTHIQGAVSFPLAEIDTRLAELNMLGAPPLLYCRTGKEAQEKAGQLAEQGIPVAFLDGGVLAWEAEGNRLVRAG